MLFESFMYLQGDLHMGERILRRRAYKNSWAKPKRRRLRAEKTRRQLFGLEGTVTANAESISGEAERMSFALCCVVSTYVMHFYLGHLSFQFI